MKSFILSIALLSGSIISSDTPTDQFWFTNYKEAASLAKKDNKPMMLYFSGSDWCKPCIIWKKDVFDTDEFKNYANSNLIAVKLDFPRLKKNRLTKVESDQNEKLAGKFNSEGIFPLIVFVDSDGKVIEKSPYRPGGPKEFIEYSELVLAEDNR
jgi:thioredoxin-related protein